MRHRPTARLFAALETSVIDWRPRFISSRTPPSRRRVYLAVTAYFIAVSAAMVWPLYLLASRVEPTVLGLPLSLAYLTALVIVSFLVALALYLWEDRQGVLESVGNDGEARAERRPSAESTTVVEPAAHEPSHEPPGSRG